MRYLFILLVLFAGIEAAADQKIYRSVDENGNPVFTDIPPRNSNETKTEVDLNPANSYQSGSARPLNEPGLPPVSADTSEGFYQILNVTSPSNDGTLRDNAGNVHIEGYLQPNLRAGHQLRLVLDGALTELEADGLQFDLSNVDRGSHQVQLVIVDGQGSHLMTSQTSTFHMQRFAPAPKSTAPPAKAQ